MITDQPVNNHDGMHKVTDNMLREVGLTIKDSGGKVTFAGKEPVRKTVMKAGAAPAIILAANAVAEAAIWKERTGEGQDIHVDLRKAWIEQSPWRHCQSKILNTWNGHRTAQIDPEKCKKINGHEIRL
jgi:hypothetical protein